MAKKIGVEQQVRYNKGGSDFTFTIVGTANVNKDNTLEWDNYTVKRNSTKGTVHENNTKDEYVKMKDSQGTYYKSRYSGDVIEVSEYKEMLKTGTEYDASDGDADDVITSIADSALNDFAKDNGYKSNFTSRGAGGTSTSDS